MFKTGFMMNTAKGVSAKLYVEGSETPRWLNGGIYDGRRALIVGASGIAVSMHKLDEPIVGAKGHRLVFRGEVLGTKAVGFATEKPGIISLVPDAGYEGESELVPF